MGREGDGRCNGEEVIGRKDKGWTVMEVKERDRLKEKILKRIRRGK